jgi:hypothetical protein
MKFMLVHLIGVQNFGYSALMFVQLFVSFLIVNMS